MFPRKHDDVEKSDLKVNTVAGSRRKRRKKDLEDEVSESDDDDDDESVHTSDMSTDEEDSSPVTLGNSGVKESTVVDSGSVTLKTVDSNLSKVTNELTSSSSDKNSQTCSNRQEDVDDKPNSVSSEKVHVRSTSGKWSVTNVLSHHKRKIKCEPVSDKSSIGLPAVDNASSCVEKVIEHVKKEVDQDTDKSSTTPNIDVAKEIKKKVVNIPVEREKSIQVRINLFAV